MGRRALMAPLLALILAACEQPDMADQPRVDTYEPNTAFSDGRAARPIPGGTVARHQGEPRRYRSTTRCPSTGPPWTTAASSSMCSARPAMAATARGAA